MKMRFSIVLAAVVAIAMARDYSGYQTLRISPKRQGDLKILREFERDWTQIDFWQFTKRLDRTVDIMVPPALLSDVKDFLENHGLPFSIGINDVQQLIDQQAEERKNSVSSTDGFDYYMYHTYQEIRDWVSNFAAEHPNLIEVQDVAQSFEGRGIAMMKIGNPREDGAPKKAVFYQAGIHAREWLSPATVILIIKQMVEDYGADDVVTKMLDTFDYYIIPQLNADGYVYTWEEDRMWRKNRRVFPGANPCVGVDMNRNYPIGFGGSGASDLVCSDVYHGEGPFSEIELSAIATFLYNLQESGVDIVHFIDFHTYSQLILGPWSYSASDPDPDDIDEHTEAAEDAASALEAVYGCQYICGPTAKTLYEAAGSSNDWGYVGLNAKYSYVMELRDTGDYGFLVPKSVIDVSGKETYEAVKSFGNRIVAEYGA